MSDNISNLVPGIAGGTHVTGGPLTTTLAEQASPGLLTNAIDRAVVKIRPMATPLDQISRLGHVRRVDSLEVDYYSVDTRRDRAGVVSASAVQGGAEVTVDDASPFEVSDTVCVCVDGEGMCVGYVSAKDDVRLTVLTPDSRFATLEEGATLVRMGRAATQLDVQSPQFAVLPRRSTNLCQIFKAQIEQSVVMRLSHKEIGWNFTDQQEAAVYDMKLGMEKQFLFGTKMKVYDPAKGEQVTLTEGIWSQAGRDIYVDTNGLDTTMLVDMLRTAFTENSGSRRKVLIAGSGLIAALNKLDATRVITARDQVTAWGIDFSEICSKFGRLYVVFSEIFDLMGMPGNGMVVDPEYIQKHVFIPFTAESIDLRGSGQRNTEAMVLTEASCLTLRYPDAHARVRSV